MMSGQSRPVSRLSLQTLQTTPAGSICRDRSPGTQLERRREVAVRESWSLGGEMENSVAVHSGPGASIDGRLCPCKNARRPDEVESPESSPSSKSRLTRRVPQFDSYVASLPREASYLFPRPFQVRQGALRCGKKGGGPAVLASVRVCFAAHTVKLWPTSDPFAVFGSRYCTKALHARTKPILHSKCDERTAAVLSLLTCCQSHLSFLFLSARPQCRHLTDRKSVV